ncbi:hypothetical protein Cgig2_008552 [Carnegiea gigantea]|uniref:Uncharacterized protein n=1 Tax=Carnegiea gigantea TaxID=171969 RepID=A0A9Q1H097_9CARY|nr:hypothetical protein Cgig2_008552 [Carnegiea gigantea]
MAKHVVRHFVWDQHGVSFPPLPLPKDFQALCLSYELAMAEEAAEDYELPELPQVIFYMMLLNEAERLGVLHGRALRTLESALTELRWSTFESWRWRRATCPPHPLPEDYYVLCPCFSLPEAEGTTSDFELLEMMQSTFNAMLLNEAIELGVVRSFIPVHKRQRTEGRPDVTAASTPVELNSLSLSTLKVGQLGIVPPVSRDTPPPLKPWGLFLRPSAGLVKSWDLVTSSTSDPPRITEEEVTMAEAFALGDTREDEKKDLQRQLKGALAKAKAEATAGAEMVAQAKEQGYQQGRAHTLGIAISRPTSTTYVDERQRAEDEGRGPEEVEFIPPSGEGEGAQDEATNPLDADGGASEEEGHEDSGGSDEDSGEPYV